MLLRVLCSVALAFVASASSDDSNPHPEPPQHEPPPPPPKTGLDQIEHVIFLMMENRAFDHYYGSFAGVRGFKDPNVQVNPEDVKQGLPNVFYQSVLSLV